ncbi:MAG: ferritin [Planctomycetota bacterium]|jgi:ferritin
MINEKVRKVMNDQIVAETYSAYLYLSMSAWFDGRNLKGFASWMKCQAQEELTHAILLFNHVLERGGKVELGAIEAPPSEWASPVAVFEATYAHEQKVTALINAIVDVAEAEKDRASMPLLQWFVKEQIEEEASASELLESLKLAGEGGGLFMLDREAGARVFTYPPPVLAGG